MNIKELLKVNLKQKPNTRETIIYSVALIFVCFSLCRHLIYGPYSAIADAKRQLVPLEEERTHIAQLLAMPEKFVVATKARRWVGNSPEAFDGAAEEITNLIHQKGVTIQKLQLGAVQKEGAFTSRDASLTILGSYDTLGRFIEHLEGMPAPLVIQALSMQPDVDNPDNVVVNLKGSIYGRF